MAWLLYTHKKRVDRSHFTGREVHTVEGKFWSPLDDHDKLQAIGDRMMALGNIDGYAIHETHEIPALPPARKVKA